MVVYAGSTHEISVHIAPASSEDSDEPAHTHSFVSHTQRMGVDDDSDQTLDLLHRWIREHGRLKSGDFCAYAVRRHVPKSCVLPIMYTSSCDNTSELNYAPSKQKTRLSLGIRQVNLIRYLLKSADARADMKLLLPVNV